jgi:hypothetical protein
MLNFNSKGNPMLSLAEELMLLALKDEKGSVIMSASTALPYGLAGALLLDLFFRQKITFNGKTVEVVDPAPTGDTLLDETLALISGTEKHKTAKYWVQKIERKIKKLRDRIADQLVQKEILKPEEHRLLWVFQYQRYPTVNISPEMEIRQRIRKIVLLNHPPDDKDRALISLVKACSLVNEIFSGEERRQAKKRIKEITEEEKIGKAVSYVVAEITAAVTAVVIITAASTSSSS